MSLNSRKNQLRGRVVPNLTPDAVVEFVAQMSTLVNEPDPEVCLSYLCEANGDLSKACHQCWRDKRRNLPRLKETNLPDRTMENSRLDFASKSAQKRDETTPAMLRMKTISRATGRSVVFLMLREGRNLKLLPSSSSSPLVAVAQQKVLTPEEIALLPVASVDKEKDGEEEGEKEGEGEKNEKNEGKKNESSAGGAVAVNNQHDRLLRSFWRVRITVRSTGEVLESSHTKMSLNPQWGDCMVVSLDAQMDNYLDVELITQSGVVLGTGEMNINPHRGSSRSGQRPQGKSISIRELIVPIVRGRARGTIHMLMKRPEDVTTSPPPHWSGGGAAVESKMQQQQGRGGGGSSSSRSKKHGGSMLRMSSAPDPTPSSSSSSRRGKMSLRQASAGVTHQKNAVYSLSSSMQSLAQFQQKIASWVDGGSTPMSRSTLRSPTVEGGDRVRLLVMLPKESGEEIVYLLTLDSNYKDIWVDKLNDLGGAGGDDQQDGSSSSGGGSGGGSSEQVTASQWSPLFRCVLCKRDSPEEVDAAERARYEAEAAEAARKALPYEGDIMAAMRAGDRSAIRLIQASKNAKPPRVSRQGKSNKLPCEHRYCVACLIRSATTKGAEEEVEEEEEAWCRCCETSTFISEVSLSLNKTDLTSYLDPDTCDRLLSLSLEQLVSNDPTFVRCPNQNCRLPLEHAGRMLSFSDAIKLPLPEGVEGPGGRVLTDDEIAHFHQCRLRCTSCAVVFCTECRAMPYHVGMTCDSYSLSMPGKCR